MIAYSYAMTDSLLCIVFTYTVCSFTLTDKGTADKSNGGLKAWSRVKLTSPFVEEYILLSLKSSLFGSEKELAYPIKSSSLEV